MKKNWTNPEISELGINSTECTDYTSSCGGRDGSDETPGYSDDGSCGTSHRRRRRGRR